MRIAFDGTTLRPGRTGVGYYTEHLLQHLVRAPGSHDEIIVISNRPIDTVESLPPHVRVETSHPHVPRMVWLRAFAPRMIASLRPDVVHFTNGMLPPQTGVPSVVTIHDMSLTLYPKYHPRRRVLLNRPLVDLAARRADAVVAVSESAKRDIVALYGLAPDRVHVIHEAAAPAFQPVRDSAVIDRVRRRYGLAARIVLYVGTVEPRKNLENLIAAFADRRRAGELSHQLVCAGPYGWLSQGVHRLVRELRLEDAVRFIGYVPFEDLPALYSSAEMFVFPSIYEGFGLPVIEAMACGVPVVAGRNSSMGEIGGEAIEAVNPTDKGSLGDALVRLAASRARREELAARGLTRAQTFSWDHAARQTLDIYRCAVASPAAHRHSAAVALKTNPDFTPAIVETASATPRVLFGQAYYLRFDPKLWAAGQPYPPLGTLYAAAASRARGYDVSVFDAMLASSEAEWTGALERHRPQLAVLYEDNFNYLSKMCLLRMRQAALTMTAAARARGVTVVASGSDATDHPDIYLAGGAEAVVIGEGEETLIELLDALTHRSRCVLSEVKGIAFRDERGGVVRTAPRPVIHDLDALPFPAWDLVDMPRYRSIWLRRHGFHSMNLVTTRGCPYRCNWCAKPIYGQRYNVRSPESVVAEMVRLKETYRPDHLWIADDIFGLKPGWTERFSELVTSAGAEIPFKCLMRADQISTAVAAALKRAACRTVWIGAESGSQRVLNAMDKGIEVGEIRSATARLHVAGIEVGFFLQFGYPGETREDVEQTLQMVRDCRPDDIGISVSYPLPGTVFYERVKAQLGPKQNWVDSDDLDMMYRAFYAPAFYRTLHSLVHAEFRARKAADAWRGAGGRMSWRLRSGAAYAYNTGRLSIFRRRLTRLARLTASEAPAVRLPMLGTREVAVPDEPVR